MSSALPIILILLIVIVFIVAIAIGANDETMASVVGAKALTLNSAILLGAALQIIGAQLLGAGVTKTIGADMVYTEFPIDIVLLLAIAMTAWLFISSIKGYPISTTHSIVGCILGIGLWIEFTSATPLINWVTISNILIGWILSPLFGLIIAYILQAIVRKVVLPRAKGSERAMQVEVWFGWLLLAMVIITGLSRGGNDVSKAVGILTMVFTDPITWPLLLLLGGAGMAVGLFLIGRRVVATVGMEVTELRPSTGFAAETAVALVLFIGTVFGIPLSGTHVLVAAVVGVGLANQTPIQAKAMKKIILASFLTVPISAIFALSFFFAYRWIQPFLLAAITL